MYSCSEGYQFYWNGTAYLYIWPIDNGHLHLQLVIVSQSFMHSGIPYNQVIYPEMVGVAFVWRLFCQNLIWDLGAGLCIIVGIFYGYMAAKSGSTAISTKAKRLHVYCIFLIQRWIVARSKPPKMAMM